MFIVTNEGGQDVRETSGDRGRRGGGRGELSRMISVISGPREPQSR